MLENLRWPRLKSNFKVVWAEVSHPKNSISQWQQNSYLTEKQMKKGKEITYSKIEMAEYLLPDSNLSTEQKRRLFSIRNKMVDISDNFSSREIETFCYCGEREMMSHIYYCKLLCENNSELISYYFF